MSREGAGVAVWIAVCAFGVRLAAALSLSEEQVVLPDSKEYVAIADRLLAGEGFSLDGQNRAKRLPAYPLFLAAHRAAFEDRVLPVQISQAAIGALSCVLLLLLAAPILGIRAARAAALVLALYPLHAAGAGAILVETLLTLFVLLEIVLLRAAVKGGRGRYAALAGVAGGAATLLQAGHALFFFVLALFAWKAARPRSAAGMLAVFVGASLILPALWTIRNAVVLGEFVPLTTHSGKTLYDSFGPGARGGAESQRIVFPPREDRGEVEYDAHLRARALEEAAGNPLRSVRLGLQKQRRFWNVLPNHPEYRSAAGAAAALCFAPVLAFFVVALLRIGRLGWSAAWLLAPVFWFALVHAVIAGSIRYRLPVEPYIIALAAWAAVDLWARLRRGGARAGGPAPSR